MLKMRLYQSPAIIVKTNSLLNENKFMKIKSKGSLIISLAQYYRHSNYVREKMNGKSTSH